jgi:hypothetical protein
MITSGFQVVAFAVFMWAIYGLWVYLAFFRPPTRDDRAGRIMRKGDQVRVLILAPLGIGFPIVLLVSWFT